MSKHDWTRREILRSGLAAAGVTMLPNAAIAEAATPVERPSWMQRMAVADTPRERLLLDAGWRFPLGPGDDPRHGFEPGTESDYAKAGRLFEASRPQFDASAWHAVDLPHDWAVDLPYVADPRLVNWGFKPLHREYRDSSIG